MMQELFGNALATMLKNEPGRYALFFQTPLCGTCQAASRMLEIVQFMLPQLRLFSVNVNLSPRLAQEWRISSVPCVILVRGGSPVEALYLMESVQALYRFLAQASNE